MKKRIEQVWPLMIYKGEAEFCVNSIEQLDFHQKQGWKLMKKDALTKQRPNYFQPAISCHVQDLWRFEPFKKYYFETTEELLCLIALKEKIDEAELEVGMKCVSLECDGRILYSIHNNRVDTHRELVLLGYIKHPDGVESEMKWKE